MERQRERNGLSSCGMNMPVLGKVSALDSSGSSIGPPHVDGGDIYDGHAAGDDVRSGVLILTAYSDNYSLGKVCECVNRSYAKTFGYLFQSYVKSQEVMLEDVQPKTHCTWFKIKLLRDLLSSETMHELSAQGVQYVMWMDADAIFIDHDQSLEKIIESCQGRELIIGEDMHPGCLINAGVFIIRICSWSRDFIERVWCCVLYDDVPFYEQSAMIKCLKSSGEGFGTAETVPLIYARRAC